QEVTGWYIAHSALNARLQRAGHQRVQVEARIHPFADLGWRQIEEAGGTEWMRRNLNQLADIDSRRLLDEAEFGRAGGEYWLARASCAPDPPGSGREARVRAGVRPAAMKAGFSEKRWTASRRLGSGVLAVWAELRRVKGARSTTFSPPQSGAAGGGMTSTHAD